MTLAGQYGTVYMREGKEVSLVKETLNGNGGVTMELMEAIKSVAFHVMEGDFPHLYGAPDSAVRIGC